jgi:haloalkane dehalogenase
MAGMSLIRTPDERFADLPEYPFEPRDVAIDGPRMHYVDEGKGDVLLCLHGEPTWSYLYRRMIAPLSRRFRVIAPDYFGFGRSDKFTEPEAYSFQMHYDSIVAFCDHLGLDEITLVAQDWGGLIGLRMLGEMPDRFSRIVLMNTGPATGQKPLGPGFMNWLEYVKRTPDLPIRKLFERSFIRPQSKTPAILDAYEAPFPDARYKVGAQRFPFLVPLQPDDPGAAEMRKARDVLATWTKPCLLMFSDQDPVIGVPVGKALQRLIPSARELITITGAGHFLQEDKAEELTDNILTFMDQS